MPVQTDRAQAYMALRMLVYQEFRCWCRKRE